MFALASFLFQEAKGDYVRYDFFFSFFVKVDAIHKVLDAIDAFQCSNSAKFDFCLSLFIHKIITFV